LLTCKQLTSPLYITGPLLPHAQAKIRLGPLFVWSIVKIALQICLRPPANSHSWGLIQVDAFPWCGIAATTEAGIFEIQTSSAKTLHHLNGGETPLGPPDICQNLSDIDGHDGETLLDTQMICILPGRRMAPGACLYRHIEIWQNESYISK
jgi:hypothetical protein